MRCIATRMEIFFSIARRASHVYCLLETLQFLTLSNIAIKLLYCISRKEKSRRKVGIILLTMQQNIAQIFEQDQNRVITGSLNRCLLFCSNR